MIIRVKHKETEIVLDESHLTNEKSTSLRWEDQREAIHTTLSLIFEHIKSLYDES